MLRITIPDVHTLGIGSYEAYGASNEMTEKVNGEEKEENAMRI